MTPISVVRPNGDLERQVWEFYYHFERHTLYVNQYRFETRPTKRHGWRTSECYDRLNIRDSSVKTPPLPEDVRAEAIAEFVLQAARVKCEAEYQR